MGPTQPFIGIEMQHSWRLYTYAALTPDLKLLALRQGRLPDVLTYLAAQDSALVAVNSPPHPNRGRIKREENRPGLFGDLPGNHTTDLRQVEYELLTKGYPIPRTPSDHRSCPAWARRGFRLTQELADAGYTVYSEKPADRQYLETSPEAVYKSLLGCNPFVSDSIQGRIQRQLILWKNQLPVRDSMVFFEEVTRFRLLYSILPDQEILPLAHLNALAAAFIAYLVVNHPARIVRYGEAEEGIIYLPSSS